MNYLIISLLLIFLAVTTIPTATAQTTIIIPDATPCFLEYSSDVEAVWTSCGVKDDWLQFLVLPFNWALGGLLSVIIISLVIWSIWMKYKQTYFAILVGIMLLPVSYSFFPEHFVTTSIILAFLALGIGIWWALVRQTKGF